MPMWFHKRRPTPPPRPVIKAGAAAAVLSDQLMDAIMTGDMAAARQVFDRAFWDKTSFRPDGYHLLQAVRRGSREMVTLLTTHGATWTPDETKMARLMANKQWDTVEGLLRQAGIRTQFSDGEMSSINPFTACAWARRSVEDAERRLAPDAPQARADFERVMAAGVAVLMKSANAAQAVKLLLSRGERYGDGRAVHPVDVSREIHELIRQPQGEKLAVCLLDALNGHGLRVKPLTLSGTALWMAPGLLKELDARGILGAGQTENRLIILHNWSVMQPKIDTGAGVIELDAALVETQHKALRQAAEVLFRNNLPAREAEADAYVGMHEARAKQAPEALARMEKELLDLGFFDSPAFTVRHLKRLSETAPQEDGVKTGTLAARFNCLASRRMLSEYGVEKFLSSSKFQEIEAAHRLRAYKASAAETVKILDYLSSQVKKDVVPEDVASALKTLRNGGADFSRVNPNRYLGKKAPGLCKTLLDLGLVTPQSIDIERIARRNGNEIRPLMPRDAPGFADQEFMCQLVLEQIAPEKYIPKRGQAGVDYRRDLIREYVANKLLKRRLQQPRRYPGPL